VAYTIRLTSNRPSCNFPHPNFRCRARCVTRPHTPRCPLPRAAHTAPHAYAPAAALSALCRAVHAIRLTPPFRRVRFHTPPPTWFLACTHTTHARALPGAATLTAPPRTLPTRYTRGATATILALPRRLRQHFRPRSWYDVRIVNSRNALLDVIL